MDGGFKNDTVNQDEPFRLSDTSVIATLLAVGIILIIAISIGTWQCMKKSSPRRVHQPTPFKRLRSSTRSAFSRTSLSPEQFQRLLTLYYHAGSNERDANNRPLSTVREEQEALERSDTTNLSGLPFALSPGSSVEGYAPRERLRQSSDTSPGNRSMYPVGIFSTTLLDISSPVSSYLDEQEMSRQSSDGRRCARVRPRNYQDSPVLSQSTVRTPVEASSTADQGTSLSLSPDLSLEPSEQKLFYFAWPEEEEEDIHDPGWSPLCLKASMDSFRESICTDDKALGTIKEKLNKTKESTSDLSYTQGVSIGAPSISSTPGLSRKGVVTSTNVVLPYGLKSTWV